VSEAREQEKAQLVTSKGEQTGTATREHKQEQENTNRNNREHKQEQENTNRNNREHKQEQQRERGNRAKARVYLIV
jgi:hypothetical protein